MNGPASPLSGVHHVRIPVSDLDDAAKWFSDLLGYQREFPFKRDGAIVGWALQHPNGGPSLALIEDSARAKALSGFPLLAFGLADEDAVRRMAARLDDHGISHGGVQPALVKVKLPFVEGPEGIQFGFYAMDQAQPRKEDLP